MKILVMANPLGRPLKKDDTLLATPYSLRMSVTVSRIPKEKMRGLYSTVYNVGQNIWGVWSAEKQQLGRAATALIDANMMEKRGFPDHVVFTDEVWCQIIFLSTCIMSLKEPEAWELQPDPWKVVWPNGKVE